MPAGGYVFANYCSGNTWSRRGSDELPLLSSSDRAGHGGAGTCRKLPAIPADWNMAAAGMCNTTSEFQESRSVIWFMGFGCTWSHIASERKQFANLRPEVNREKEQSLKKTKQLFKGQHTSLFFFSLCPNTRLWCDWESNLLICVMQSSPLWSPIFVIAAERGRSLPWWERHKEYGPSKTGNGLSLHIQLCDLDYFCHFLLPLPPKGQCGNLKAWAATGQWQLTTLSLGGGGQPHSS